MGSLLNGAKLNGPLHKGVWAECANTATVTENLSVSRIDEKPPYERFHQRPSQLVRNLRSFGEMAVATKKNKIQGKLDNKGVHVMFVGYAPDHAPKFYRLLKMSNKRIVMSRDVRWLKQNYTEWKYKQDDDDDDASDEDEGATEEQVAAEDYQEEKEAVDTTASIKAHKDTTSLDSALARANIAARKRSENAKLIRAMSKLGSFYNPDAQKIKHDAVQQKERHEAESNAIIEQEGSYDEELSTVALDHTVHQSYHAGNEGSKQ
jgi:hypothetical protein